MLVLEIHTLAAVFLVLNGVYTPTKILSINQTIMAFLSWTIKNSYTQDTIDSMH